MASRPILYVGSDSKRPDVRALMSSIGFGVVWVPDADGAIAELEKQDIPVLVDLNAGREAVQAAVRIREHRPKGAMVLVADPARPDLTEHVHEHGFREVLSRPVSPHALVNALQRQAMPELRELEQLTGAPELISGGSAAIEVVRRQLAGAASRRHVLITGEPASGREAVARAIHAIAAGTGKSNAPFVVADCARLNRSMLARKLFGLASRSARGAGRTVPALGSRGLVWRAQGGTLLLKDPFGIPPGVQERLAKLLRSRRVVVIGDDASRSMTPLDVRVVAILTVPPGDDAERPSVRPGLVEIFSGCQIVVPPLRRRREDVPALVQHMLRRASEALHMPPKNVSSQAMLLLAALPWFGNVRELSSVVQRLVLGVPGRLVRIEDVIACVSLEAVATRAFTGISLREAKEQFEREYIAGVLERFQGSVPEAASALGIQRTNLYRKLRGLRLVRARGSGDRAR